MCVKLAVDPDYILRLPINTNDSKKISNIVIVSPIVVYSTKLSYFLKEVKYISVIYIGTRKRDAPISDSKKLSTGYQQLWISIIPVIPVLFCNVLNVCKNP